MGLKPSNYIGIQFSLHKVFAGNLNPNQNTPCVKKVMAKNLKMAILKNVKSKWVTKASAVGGIKIFDNDD